MSSNPPPGRIENRDAELTLHDLCRGNVKEGEGECHAQEWDLEHLAT
jgi:hypothetical protein